MRFVPSLALEAKWRVMAEEWQRILRKWQACWCICQHLLRFACLKGVAAAYCDAAAADEWKLVECHGTCERKGWRK